ncbi:hypothetical protein ATANTOWER_028904, partial [Ataeniobius toweri]|nr:hypothetical protein [Ataeniobius toweri]
CARLSIRAGGRGNGGRRVCLGTLSYFYTMNLELSHTFDHNHAVHGCADTSCGLSFAGVWQLALPMGR